MYSFQSPSIPNPAKSCLTLLASSAMLTLAACGGGGGGGSGSSSSDNNAQGSIQGEWQAECEVLADGLSGRRTAVFDGSDFELTGIFYVGTDACNNGNIFTLVTDSSFTLLAETTDTALGTAQHIDIETAGVDASSSQPLDAQLALQNSSFDELVFSLFGATDTSNIEPQSIGLESSLFTLVLVENDTLYVGDTESNQGTSPETRHTELGQDVGDIFTRR